MRSNSLFASLLLAAAVLVGSSRTACAEDAQSAVASITAKVQAGQFHEAVTLLDGSLSEYPRDPDLWNLAGIAKTELRDFDGARDAFEHGLRLAPNSLALHENFGLLYYRQADYPDARKYLTAAQRLGSTNAGVLFSLAASELRTGDAPEALSRLKSLEQSLGTLPEYWDERGRAEDLKDPVTAEQSYNHALQLRPDDLTALNGAASCAERQGLDEKALAYLVRAREAKPDDVLTLAHFGAVCIRRDLGLDARDALTKAHSLDPSNNTVLFLLARANVSLGNWQEAYDLFTQFSKRVPGYAPTYYALGWLDEKLSRPDDARRQIQHSLDLDPKLSDARRELAQLQLDDGDISSAKSLLQTVIKDNPHDAKAHLALGDILMRQGDLPAAKASLATAAREDPKLAAAHYKLSLVLTRIHEPEQAEAERTLAAKLTVNQQNASKTQLKLILPDTLQN